MIAAVALVFALLACIGVVGTVAGVVWYVRDDRQHSQEFGELIGSMFNALTLPAWPARPRRKK